MNCEIGNTSDIDITATVIDPVANETNNNTLLDSYQASDMDQEQLRFIAQENSVCDMQTPNGPTGLKRGNSDGIDKTTRKRVYCYNRDHDITAQKISELNPDLAPEDVNEVLHDYNFALRILKSRKDNQYDANPNLEYMIGLINDWKPRREVICMYVRWSKRLRRNFHLDSISTLLCVAKQCDYKPYVFLKNIKTLTIIRSTTTYGLCFKFDTSNNKAIDGKKLNDKFLGLSITLRLLQRAVVPSSGTFGKIGLKTSPMTADATADDVFMTTGARDTNHKYVASKKPTSRFHTTGGLTGRIWLAIQHRWIALQVVELLFPTELAHSNSEHDSLAFSFQMHSLSGPTRFDFLDPLIGVCLRYRSTSIIDNHANVLGAVWEDPSTFVAFGNRLLQSSMRQDRIQCIFETFDCLQAMIRNSKCITMHRKTDRETRWQMIRAYAFHFWLEREHNQELKTEVDGLCKKSSRSTHKGTYSESTTDVSQPALQSTPRLLTTGTPTNSLQRMFDRNNKSGTSRTFVGVSDNNSTHSGGLTQILKSRKVIESKSQSNPPSQFGGTNRAATKPVSLRPNMENNQPIGHSKTYTLVSPLVVSKDPMLFQWDSMRLATQCEISSRVSSNLLIHRDDGITLVQELAPIEVYSANMLYRFRHSRRTATTSALPRTDVGDVVLSINANIQQYTDQSSRMFHVAREESTFFKEHGHLLPSILQLSNLCKAIFKYGISDPSRSSQQFRINIGCGGLHMPNGKPETLIGLQFKKKLEIDPNFNAAEVIGTIGVMTEFTWNILKDMQHAASDGPLAPDLSRRRQYASHLARYLNMNEDVGFEDITVVIGVMYPVMPNVAEHVDSMNDSVAGYTRTGALNVVLIMGQETDITLLHVQVLCNFRRVIREYLFPCHQLLSSIVVNCKNHLHKWQVNMNQIYGGKTRDLPSPFARTNIFMDDCLSFTELVISNGSQTGQTITGEYLLTEISPSRVLSFSMFIDPIVDLSDSLCHDQQMELCFVASVLSNPFWFEYILSSLTHQHFDSENSFHFGIHPLYDWSTETLSVFGSWQGGPYNRWSPCGGQIPFLNLFGAHKGASKEEQHIGCAQLEQVLEILHHHLQWVNSLKGRIDDVTQDLPLSTVEAHMTTVTEAIYTIVPCQFSIFRLMVFTTICAGCGLINEGTHLKAIMYPVKGSASFKHVMNVDQDRMTRRHALALCGQESEEIYDRKDNEPNDVESQQLDQMLLYVSNELGMIKYLRDETECILCESHPNRNLHCQDWFKKGRRIYDLDMNGNIIQREYGLDTEWKNIRVPTRKKFAFLKEIIVYIEDDDTVKEYVTVFGDVLQGNQDNIKFRGGDKSMSEFVKGYNQKHMYEMALPFPVIQLRTAYFVDGKFTIQNIIDNAHILYDSTGEYKNTMDYPEGVHLWNYVSNIVFGYTNKNKTYSARYDQDQIEPAMKSGITVFPGHLAKTMMEHAIFLALTQRGFFTIIAIPSTWNVEQDENAYKRIQVWMESLPVQECEAIHTFLQKFRLMARVSMKIVDVDVRIFFNSAGTILAFPANSCFHTTIFPGHVSSSENEQDIFIFHTKTVQKD